MISPVSFKSNSLAQQQSYPSDIKDRGSHYEYTYETEGSTGKKWGVGIGSAILPGLGQAINGQWGKGFAFFGGSIAINIAQILLAAKGKTGAALTCVAGNIGARIWSVVDAVKNAKSEIKQVVPKEQVHYNYKA